MVPGVCQVATWRRTASTELDWARFYILVVRCLRIDLPGKFSLIYVALFKPGPLGRFLGPTFAENRPETEKN